MGTIRFIWLKRSVSSYWNDWFHMVGTISFIRMEPFLTFSSIICSFIMKGYLFMNRVTKTKRNGVEE
ncbi:hypothetical protein F9995_10570 [Bacteroides salyersiae]|nr:hypothetical protein GAA62_07905 [Bacteroides salyersiae]KAB5354506.1 hypothetical protein GAA37_05765 [Bacteroides salyersiae]KAB5364512.1 hypothetical protein F9967_02005 [Bacteroides salyersiae]KAB5369432.1 hypothetical protein GAA00_06425 [Bacteroides salyersiae]KAB5375394.1 hypothetical protein F9993_08960 [Bacteroides salyersiae]